MNTGVVTHNFLSKPDELGVVAVGFAGGQVCPLTLCLINSP